MTDDATPKPAGQSNVKTSIAVNEARNFATATKTTAQMAEKTPRHLLKLLPWVTVEGGAYRVNRRKMVAGDDEHVETVISDGNARIEAEALRAMQLFRKTDEMTLQGLANKFVSQFFERGAEVFPEGSVADKLYIVAHGNIEIYAMGKRGDVTRLNIVGDGDYFGEMAFVTGHPRTASARAVTPTILLSLDLETFRGFLAQSPGLKQGLDDMAAPRLSNNPSLNEYGEAHINVAAGHEGEHEIDGTYVSYEEKPREFHLSLSQAVVRLHTRIADLYNSPIDPLREQLRLTIESMKERQEWEIINNDDFGLLNNIDRDMRVRSVTGVPTPDAMDDLLSKVWKEPSFFLAHPRAIAAFGRECTRRGVPPPTMQLFDSTLLTWRGIPLVPCDKLMIGGRTRPRTGMGTTSILLLRVGEQKQGVVGLHKTGLAGEVMPSLTVRSMGINTNSVAEYLVSLYYSAAVLTEDAIGVLEDVEVGHYYEYK